ncbi:MAG: polyprenol monophosphomannose synthase [Bacteroidetes bacterium]|nr:MAG: polyprenol monophosphomannose synthase [Bacteroidota bacterium]TAG90383.1 MAG: polyprenol monophosphomannose synthase [Bacteroidota bacterium]
MSSIVIIPTYNEKENIAEMIETVMNLSLLDDSFHLLIIDDGSPDGTAEIVKEYQKKYPQRLFLEQRKGKLGLGTAYIHGFKWALSNNYDLIFEMDADFSHNPQDLIKLYHACTEENFDVAIGSRYIQGVNVVNWPMSRVLMSYFAGYYVRFITGMKIMDTTAGFKCYKSEVLKKIELDKIRFVGYAFQIEMKFLAWKYGFKIKEVPIIFTERTKGQSKMTAGIFREAFLGVIQMKIQSFFKRFM